MPPLSTLLKKAPWASQLAVQQAALGLLCLGVLLRTMVPTIFTLDSAEMTVGAHTLGIVHSPGYPLYLLLVKLTIWLVPVGDIAYRANLFSALCLAASAPLLYYILSTLLADRLIAASITLIGLWSRQIWLTGLYAEIYAPQLLTLTACGAGLIMLWQARAQPTRFRRCVLGTGVLVGMMIAMAPASILFVPLVIAVYGAARVPWRWAIVSGGLSLILFWTFALYLPLRSATNPALNIAGDYSYTGEFQPYDLQSIRQIFWYMRGGQFQSMFFEEGYCSPRAIAATLAWFWKNYLGIGVLFGLIGCRIMLDHQRGLLGLMLLALLPYTYFFAHYGAEDRHTMLGPVFLIWTLPLSFGLQWLLTHYPAGLRVGLAIGLPLALLVVNFPLVDLSENDSIHDYAETLLDDVPENAVIFGIWWEIAPLQYMQIVEGQRPDVTLYNFWQFHRWNVPRFVAVNNALNPADRRPVVVLTAARAMLDENKYVYDYVPLAAHATLLNLTDGLIGGYQMVTPHSDAPAPGN